MRMSSLVFVLSGGQKDLNQQYNYFRGSFHLFVRLDLAPVNHSECLVLQIYLVHYYDAIKVHALIISDVACSEQNWCLCQTNHSSSLSCLRDDPSPYVCLGVMSAVFV